MSDQQPKPVGFNGGAGNASSPASLPGEQQQTPTGTGGQPSPEYVTRQEAQQLAREAADAAYRQAQSLVDKTDSRLTKQVKDGLNNLEKYLKMQKAAGVQVTPQQEAELRNQVMLQAYQDPGPDPGGDPQTPPGQQAPAEPETPMNAITAEAHRMMKDAGVIINDNDPEAELINYDNGLSFLSSVQSAIEAKRTRTTNQPGLSTPGEPRTPQGIGGGSHQPATDYSTMPLSQIWEQAKRAGKI